MNNRVFKPPIEILRIEGNIQVKRENEEKLIKDFEYVLKKYADNSKYNFRFW